MRCQFCNTPLAADRRPDAKHCDDACRSAHTYARRKAFRERAGDLLRRVAEAHAAGDAAALRSLAAEVAAFTPDNL